MDCTVSVLKCLLRSARGLAGCFPFQALPRRGQLPTCSPWTSFARASTPLERQHPVDQRVRMEPTGERIPLPTGTSSARPVATVQAPADPHHQSEHRHLLREQTGLRAVPDDGALLSKHASPGDRSSVHESARDVARNIAKTDAYQRSRAQRKKVEILFAHLKRILKFRRLRMRGPNGARDEFDLAAAAQNLRRPAKWFTPMTTTGQASPGLKASASPELTAT